jgi:hypothetical protein
MHIPAYISAGDSLACYITVMNVGNAIIFSQATLVSASRRFN